MIDNYSPRVFDVDNLTQAQNVILGAQGSVSVQERWDTETPYLIRLLEPFNLDADSWVLDYGCGIGRVAKAIIGRWGCHVIGVDISPSMRALARSYVDDSRRFATVSVPPSRFRKFDAAIACWVLQHVNDPIIDIARIANALKSGGHIGVLNETTRMVPTDHQGHQADGIDIKALLQLSFAGEFLVPDTRFVAAEAVQRGAYWFSGTKCWS